MNYASLLMYIPILAAIIGYTVFMRRRAANAMATSRPAAIEFFRRTGYSYHDRQGMPPEVQADRAAAEANELMAMGQKQTSGENYEYSTHYVRNHNGLVIH